MWAIHFCWLFNVDVWCEKLLVTKVLRNKFHFCSFLSSWTLHLKRVNHQGCLMAAIANVCFLTLLVYFTWLPRLTYVVEEKTSKTRKKSSFLNANSWIPINESSPSSFKIKKSFLCLKVSPLIALLDCATFSVVYTLLICLFVSLNDLKSWLVCQWKQTKTRVTSIITFRAQGLSESFHEILFSFLLAMHFSRFVALTHMHYKLQHARLTSNKK